MSKIKDSEGSLKHLQYELAWKMLSNTGPCAASGVSNIKNLVGLTKFLNAVKTPRLEYATAAEQEAKQTLRK